MNKFCLLLFSVSLSVSAVAQEKFEIGKPGDSNYRYLDNYQALKSYINYSDFPNFKLGAGTIVYDYLVNPTVRNLVNKNFTETVAGNAMKMQSCVDNYGYMSFAAVTNFVNAATDAGLSVYGHTLAWHAQQPVNWLQKLVTAAPTKQAKCDTLVYAMDKWIKGMMEACGGKVKAWDLVNEPLSGDGNDGEGNYELQHSKGYKSGTWDVGGYAFYWQDYMGDYEYVRQACRLARKYGPEDIVLFINDYNLESDWDDNKKLKSLINWIKKWESDGVTKIDGIGTQMHVSYYENSYIQNSKKEHITKMFQLMAASGKLVRVSEMDMGYVDANGNDVHTGSMTETRHKNMADFYEWIIKEYFRLIPPAQQWGICQWCTTDSPSNSGWRANTPVGIWDINYYRKHVYAGFVRGLSSVTSGIEVVEADRAIEAPEGIYNLNGVKLSAKSLEDVPHGIYIVNGKKTVK